MKSSREDVLALPLQERAIRAMREGVRKAIADLRRHHLPVYVWSDGKVVELPATKRNPVVKRNGRKSA